MLAFYTLNTKILSIKNLFNSVKWLSITPKAMCQVIYIYKIDNKWLPLWLSWYRICLQCGRPGFDPWVGKIPWRRERLPIPVSWSGECCGLYSPRGHRESDKTERLLLTIINGQGLPWWSSGLDSVLTMQGAQVQSLAGELRSHMPRDVAKK